MFEKDSVLFNSSSVNHRKHYRMNKGIQSYRKEENSVSGAGKRFFSFLSIAILHKMF
jgi:hypothetical protein